MMIVGAAVQKFGPNLDAEQQILLAVSDILIEAYIAESTLLRVKKMLIVLASLRRNVKSK